MALSIASMLSVSAQDPPAAPGVEAAPGALPEPLVLYTLMGAEGDIIPNSATAVDAPELDLRVVSPVRLGPDGLWFQASPPMVRTPGSAEALCDLLSGGVELRAMRAAALTVEAVVTPADTEQTGPARIVTLSTDTTTRCFTLGQDGDMYIFRLRTTTTAPSGTPDIQSVPGAVETRAQHVLATFSDGVARIYVDGALVAEEARDGNFANWEIDDPLVLGNEATGDRPWSGGLHLVAIYDVGMSPEQVAARYAALAATL